MSATAAKDQTYALYNLTQYQLEHTLMPVGEYTKDEIREIALKMNLPVANKPDSQEICFISDNDRDQLVAFVKGQRTPDYDDQVVSQSVNVGKKGSSSLSADEDDRDERFDEAVKAIQESGQASSSFLQRRLKLGYARAARLIDQLEAANIIGPSKSNNKARDILVEHNRTDGSEM